MATTTACPQVSDLKQLASGDVPPERLESLVAHLEACESCLARVQTLSSPDTLVDALGKATTLGDAGEEPVVAQLIARLKNLGKPAGITFACTECGKKIKVKAELAGKKVKCPGCGKAVAATAPLPVRTEVSEEKTILPDAKQSAAPESSEQKTVLPTSADATVDTPAKKADATHAMPHEGADSELRPRAPVPRTTIP